VPAVATKVAIVEPWGTRTLAGTERNCGELLDKVTVTPPDPAAWVSVTVQLDAPPDTRTVGAHNAVDKAGAEGLDPIVVSNSTGCRPFTSAMTATIDPVVPDPRVKVMEAWP
jgi:hypothetical protein